LDFGLKKRRQVLEPAAFFYCFDLQKIFQPAQSEEGYKKQTDCTADE